MPNEKRGEYLKQLIRYRAPIQSKHYSFVPTSGGINVDRLVNGKAYWEEAVVADDNKIKKFIISDWSVRYGLDKKLSYSSSASIKKCWEFLLSQGVECYVWTGKLSKVEDVYNLLAALEFVEPISQPELRKKIAQAGISKDESEIIDFPRYRQIRKDIGFSYESEIINFKWKDFSHLDPPTLELLIRSLPKNTKVSTDIDRDMPRHFFMLLCEHFDCIEELELDLIESSLVNEMLNNPNFIYFKRTKCLRIKSDSSFPYHTFVKLMKYFPSTTTATLNTCWNDNAELVDSHAMPLVKKIHLYDKTLIDNQESLLCNPNLVDLSLSQCNINFSHLLHDLPILKNLEHLSLCEMNITDEQLSDLLIKCPNLKSLYINKCKNLTGTFVDQLGKYEKLTSLQLIKLAITDNCLAKLLPLCSNLKTLQLSELSNVKGEYISALPKFETIQELILDQVSCGKHSLGKLLAHFPNLDKVICSYMELHGDDFYERNNLKEVELTCTEINLKELQSLIDNSPKIEKLHITERNDIVSSGSWTLTSQLSYLHQLKITYLIIFNAQDSLLYNQNILVLLKQSPELEQLVLSRLNNLFAEPIPLQWKNITSFYMPMGFYSSTNSNFLIHLNYSLPNLSRLILNIKNWDNVTDINADVQFNHLTELEITSPITAKQLNIFLSHCPNLKKLYLTGFELGPESVVHSRQNQIEELDLKNGLVTPEALGLLLNLMPNLKNLELATRLDGEGSIPLVNVKLNKLVNLSVDTNYPYLKTIKTCTGYQLRQLLAACPQLKMFDLQKSFKKEVIIELIGKYPQIFDSGQVKDLDWKELTINGSIEDITTDQLNNILAHCPQLQFLKLAYCKDIKSDFPTHPLPRLTSLTLNGTEITAKQLKNLVLKCPLIFDINLSEANIMKLIEDPDLNIADLKKINIRSLDFNYLTISATRLVEVLENCPNLYQIRNLKKITGDFPTVRGNAIKFYKISHEDKLVPLGNDCSFYLPNIRDYRHDTCDITGNQLYRLLAHFPYLASLSIDKDNYLIKASHLYSILVQHKDLRNIYLTDSTISDLDIKALQKRFPYVTIKNTRTTRLEIPNSTIQDLSTDEKLSELQGQWLDEILAQHPELYDLIKADSNLGREIRDQSSLAGKHSGLPKSKEQSRSRSDRSMTSPDSTQSRSPSQPSNKPSKQDNRKPDFTKHSQPTPLDTNTNVKDATVYARELFIRKKNKQPEPNTYRLQVYPHLEKGKEVKYSSQTYPITEVKALTQNKKLRAIYDAKYANTSDVFYGEINIPKNHEGWFALPSLTATDEMIDLAANKDLKLGYCKKQNLFYVKPNKKLAEPLQVTFLLKANLNPFPLKEVPNINFNKLRFARNGKLERNAGYHEIMENLNKLTIEERISSLAQFCRAFTNGDTDSHSDNAIEKLNALIQQGRGACRHMTWVFKALADELGMDVRAIENDCHAYVEVLNGGKWYSLDLGGREGRLELEPMHRADKADKAAAPTEIVSEPPQEATVQPSKPAHSTPSPQAEAKAPIPSTSKESTNIPTVTPVKKDIPSIPTIAPNNPFNTWDTIKSNATTFEAYCKDIMTSALNLPANKRNVLVVLETDQIENFQQQMSAYLHQNKINNMYYLHNLGNVNEKQAIVADGKLRTAESELITTVKAAKSGDVLMSNWSDYKASYVGYNTMLDDQRKLRTTDIPAEAIVMVVLDKNKVNDMGEDFYSRFRLISECPALPTNLNDNLEKLNLKAGQTTNNFEKAIFYDTDWENLLLGKVNISGRDFILEEGLLVQAIKHKKPGLLLQNAPWDKIEFRIFMNELLLKRSFKFNGEKMTLPDDFKIHAETIKYKLASNQIKIQSAAPDSNVDFVINSQTFKYFLQNIQCENELIYTLPGLIEKNNGKALTVAVTENIAPNCYAQLISLAEKHNCTLNLVLAPNMVLPEELLTQIKVNDDARITSNAKQASIIYTNDLELAEEEAFQANPKATVVSINRDTNFNDLIEKLVKLDSTDHIISFKSVLSNIGEQLLEKDGTIILKGSLSAMLAKQLETLFLTPPFLLVNGIKKPLKGKLIIVSDVKPDATFVKVEEKHYTEKDYWRVLDKDNANNHKYADFKSALEQLKLANPMVHFNYGQLRMMANKLRRGKLSNPFKSYYRLNPADPVLVSAKNVWSKPAKTKNPDAMARRHSKILSELEYSPYLFVVGDTGVGKSTYIIEELKAENRRVFVGLDSVKEWLAAKEDGADHILFIDEANLEQEGALDILEGLFNKTPGILQDTSFEVLPKNKKVVCAGNFKHFVGRQDHRFVERHGQVFNFKELPNDVLTNRIIKPALLAAVPGLSDEEQQQIIKLLLLVYNQLNTMLPKHPLTPRNLKMQCLRLSNYLQKHPDLFIDDLQLATKMAIMDEVSSLFPEKKQKSEFKSTLGLDGKRKAIKQAIYQKLPNKLGKFVVTPTRRNPLRVIQEHFAMREAILTNPDLTNFDLPGILIEGLPGIGKSRLMIEYLKSLGYTQAFIDTEVPPSVDSTKLFYYLTPTDPDKMLAILLKAFHEGATVIIDELNSLPLEKVINKLLSGYDLNGNKAKKKGFTVAATQNPIQYAGRQILSPAFENRFRKIYLKDYPESELRQIARDTTQNKQEAYTIVDNYLSARTYALYHKKTPVPSPRNLFAYLEMRYQKLDRLAEDLAPKEFTNAEPLSIPLPKSSDEKTKVIVAEKDIEVSHPISQKRYIEQISASTNFLQEEIKLADDELEKPKVERIEIDEFIASASAIPEEMGILTEEKFFKRNDPLSFFDPKNETQNLKNSIKAGILELTNKPDYISNAMIDKLDVEIKRLETSKKYAPELRDAKVIALLDLKFQLLKHKDINPSETIEKWKEKIPLNSHYKNNYLLISSASGKGVTSVFNLKGTLSKQLIDNFIKSGGHFYKSLK